MTDHSKPNGNMNASQLVALFEDADRHPNALNHELVHCKMAELVTLAYQHYAPQPLNSDVPDELASLAYDEMERRQNAMAAVRGEIANIQRRAALG